MTITQLALAIATPLVVAGIIAVVALEYGRIQIGSERRPLTYDPPPMKPWSEVREVVLERARSKRGV